MVRAMAAVRTKSYLELKGFVLVKLGLGLLFFCLESMGFGSGLLNIS